MGRKSKMSLRAKRLNELKELKRKLRASQREEGGDHSPSISITRDCGEDVAMETPNSDASDEGSSAPTGNSNTSKAVGTIASRVRQKKRQNLIQVVEAMKRRKNSRDHSCQGDGAKVCVGLNDEQLSNIGVFLKKQTNVIQQHLQQHSDGDSGNHGSITNPPTTLKIKNEMKKLYGSNLRYTLVRDTILPDRLTGSKALCSMPWQLLVGQSEANGGELGVYSKAYLKVNTVFEPLSGPSLVPEDVTTDINARFLWPIYDEEGNISVLLDLSNEDSSTWLRYMNPAPKQGQQNVEVRFVQNTIFFVTMKNIRPGNELLYWFSPPYCKMQYLQPDPERQPMRFECDKCKVQFDSPLYAHRHITIFHPFGLKRDKHTCYICKEVIYGKKKLIEHMEKQHGTKAGWQCEECGKAVHSRSYLKEHKRKVHQSEEKARRYRCQQCGKRFKCRAHLRRHVECVHVRNFKWECEYCNKKFSLKKYLEKHVRAHKGEFPFVCDKCSKGFFDSHGLKVHLLTHSGVRPYRCTLCAMSTSTKQRLQIHFKKAHGFTDENMPQIKRQVELTLNSSPIGGFKEREKVPRQRIFRTRPIDKSVIGDRGTNNATQDKDVCQTVENLAVNTLLHTYTCNNNNEENSEPASDSNANQNNSQANNNQSNSIDECTSLSPANSNRVVPSTDHARPILQQKSTAVTIHRHNAENTRPTFPNTSQSLTTGTACNIQNMENTRPTLLSASQISTTETVHIQTTDTTRPTLPNTAQSSTIHLQNTENMRPTFSTMPPCSTTETDDVTTTRPVLQQTSPTTNTTCVNSNVVVDYPHSEHSYTPNGNNNNSMLPVSTHQENVNTSQQRRMCTSTSGILPQPTNQQRSTSMSGTLPHPTNQQTSTSTSGILSLPTNQETSTSTSGILPQPTNQQTSTSTSGTLPPPTVSYNVLPPDYYNSNVGNYQSDTPIESHGFNPLPTVQNSVTNYPPTYQGAGVPYPNTSQLTPHTIPLSSYTVNQPQWQ